MKFESGVKHPKFKPVEHYQTKSVRRVDFKKYCLKYGHNFDDFTEIMDRSKKYSTNQYYYVEK